MGESFILSHCVHMKIVILGAGQVGYSIARYLSLEHNDVSIVDHNPDVLKKLGDSLDIQPVLGHASYPHVLHDAGAQDADMIIAVTGSDEVNIVACEVSHALFETKLKIARVRSPHYLQPQFAHLFTHQHIAIDHIISPEVEVANSIHRSMSIAGAFDVMSLGDDRVTAMGLKCPEYAKILNTPLRLLASSFSKISLTVACIARGNNVFIPDGEDHILPGDDVYLLFKSEDVYDILRLFGLKTLSDRRILIIGGGNIGFALAQKFDESRGVSCKLIERNAARAEIIAHTLNHVEVLRGDAMDSTLLKEANIMKTETIVSVTNDDRVNILTALLAKQEGAKRSLALINHADYGPFISSLGIDGLINPRAITVSTILQYIRQGRIRGIHAIRNNFGELMDVEARSSTMAIGMRTQDIQESGKILIVAILRDEEVLFMPPAHTFITVNDRLIIMAVKRSIPRIEELFALRADSTNP